MTDFIEDSYCGLYCGACEIVLAYKRSQKENRKAAWEDLPKEFSDHIEKAEVRCYGCKTSDVFAGCKGCQLRDCARGKGVEFCTDCAEYPCEITDAFSDAIKEYKNIQPHCEAIIGNLKDIQELGKEKWLVCQNKMWSCSSCGERFGWYQKICLKCGKEIKCIKDVL